MARVTLDAALAAELRALEDAGLRRDLRATERRGGARLLIEGRPAIDFASNDYLGLADDPRIAAAATAALRAGGTGAAAARLIAGNHPLHNRLEEELAEWKQTEAALLFPSGYAANTGAIPALVGREDAIYSDALNHASLIDGCRLSRAAVRVYPHADADALDRLLRDDAGRFRRRLVVTDSVFSMDGDLAPLDRIAEIAREHDAWTYVDDAHGTGVLGTDGRGAAEAFGVEGRIDVVMGTLGKAIGVAGAFVAGSRTLCDLLLNRARSFVFTTGSPPALAAAALAALDIIRAEPWRRDRLRANARRLHTGLAALGLAPTGADDAHIVPVHVGDADAAVRIGAALLERGFLVGAVRPPTVPEGTSRLRITLSAAHTAEQLEGLLVAAGSLRHRARPSPGSVMTHQP